MTECFVQLCNPGILGGVFKKSRARRASGGGGCERSLVARWRGATAASGN